MIRDAGQAWHDAHYSPHGRKVSAAKDQQQARRAGWSASAANSYALYIAGVRRDLAAANAMDAPIEAALKAKFTVAQESARGGSAGERSEPALLPPGLVSNTTKGTGRFEAPGVGVKSAFSPPVAGAIAVCKHAKRCRRMKNAIGYAAPQLHLDALAEKQRYRKTLVTLTYRDADGWAPQHINAFRRRVRAWCDRRGFKMRFCWAAELQARKVLHYHMVVWVPRRFMLPKPDKNGWWPHGSTNIKEAQNAVAYIAKYVSKTGPEQAAHYPAGARMHGVGGLDEEARRLVRYWQAPFFARDALTGRADIRKCQGGYVDKYTGEFCPSPWRVVVDPWGQVWAYQINSEVVQ